MPKRYRIAVCECDELMRQLIERWLSEAGHDVTAVSMRRLRLPDSFDLVIADVASPHSAAPVVRSLRAVHGGPLLLLSARLRRGQAGSKNLARQLGVNAVLAKPFSCAELMRVLIQVMA